MTEAFIYDTVRTPRGRGKKDGALHEVPTPRLAALTLEAIRDRNGLDTSTVDDIIFGCVDPVMEAGAVIPRSAAFEAGYDFKAPGVQISRFCASGLDAVNLAASKIAFGADDIVIAGGVESMSRVGMGMAGGSWPVTRPLPSPATSCRRASRPTSSPPSMASPAKTSTPMPSRARSAPPIPGKGLFRQVRHRREGHQRPDDPR